MTRKESQEEMENGANPNEVVDAIYDDFESRTCENCKYFIEMNWTDIDNKCASNKTKITYTDKDFGCNKFERKQ